MSEIWKPLNRYEGIYEISNFGRVSRVVNMNILSWHPRKNDYIVSVTKDGKSEIIYLREAVKEHFLPSEIMYSIGDAENIMNLPDPWLEDLEGEVWKPITEEIGGHEVSNKGRVKYIGNTEGKKPKIIPQRIGTKGYPLVTLYHKKEKYTVRVHRLVAKYFIDNPEDLPFVNHIDGDKLNSHATNLEWVTPIGNMRHAVENGLMPNAKMLTDEEVKSIRGKYYNEEITQTQLAKNYGVSISVISNIVNYKTYRKVGR